MQDGFLPDSNREKFDREAGNETFAGLAIIVGIALLVWAGPWLPTAFRISTEDGVHGTYEVDSPECARNRNGRYCLSHTGTFVSDDGKVVRVGVSMRSKLPPSVRQGERIPAFDLGEQDGVYSREGGHAAAVVLPHALSAAGLAMVVGGSAHFWRCRKRKRPGAA